MEKISSLQKNMQNNPVGKEFKIYVHMCLCGNVF